jgi:hypothetical protein
VLQISRDRPLLNGLDRKLAGRGRSPPNTPRLTAGPLLWLRGLARLLPLNEVRFAVLKVSVHSPLRMRSDQLPDRRTGRKMAGLISFYGPDIHDKGLSREKTLLPALDGRFLKRPTSCTRWLSRFAFADPLSIRSTALRDQTSICGNSAKPSTKIELK